MSDSASKKKIAVLGSRSVGKSSFISRYVDGPQTEIDSYHPTIERVVEKRVKHNGKEYSLEIFDTAGQDEGSFFPLKYAVGISGYILVYSIANRDSFELVKTIHEKMLDQMGAEYAPCVVVGQKSDLASNRQVSVAEGKELAAKIRAPFVETSARDNSHIDEPVQLLIPEIIRADGGDIGGTTSSNSASNAAPATGGSWLSSWFGGKK